MKSFFEFITEIEKKNLYDDKIDIEIIKLNYKFLLENENLYKTIKDSIKKNNITHYKKFNEVNDFKEMITNFFKNDEIFFDYISLYILESFNTGLIEIIEFKKYTHIHDNINRIIRNIENINIYIRKKNNMNEKRIEKIYDFILKILKVLENEKIIKVNLYWKNGKSYKSIEIENYTSSPHIEIYQKELQTFQFNGQNYIMCETYNSIRNTNSINLETNNFEIGDKTFISKLTKKRMYIDMELLKIINNEYLIEKKIEKENISLTYKELLKNHSKLIKEKDEHAIEESSKKISTYQKAILFEFLIINNIEYCYAPILFDFRGRVYKTSPFSLTFVKELRICIHFGEYSEKFFKEYKKNKADEIIDEYLYTLDKINYNKEIIIQKNIIIKRAILWTLISIGENFKTLIGKIVTIEELILKGISTYNDKNINIEYDKKIKIIGYFKTIDMLLKNEKILKRIISKDATASVYQHLVKLLGPKNDFLKKVNLDSKNTWYDTYEFVIDDWKETRKEKIKSINFNELNKYFNRKTLKKILMTKNYGCGLEKCRTYYFENIEYDKKDREKLGVLFYDFHDFIVKNPLTTDKNINEILKFFEKNNYKTIKLSDESKIDLKYYILKTKRIDTKIKSKRYTHIIKEKTSILNENQMIKAIKANYIHTLDSALARDVAERIACLIIHDCFMVGCLEVSKLIDIINICFNTNYHKEWPYKLKKEIYSIFIVI